LTTYSVRNVQISDVTGVKKSKITMDYNYNKTIMDQKKF